MVLAEMKLPSTFKSLSSEPRTVRCFSCNAENEVPADALSLICVTCGKAVDLESYEIESVFSRSIQTHGEVIIGVRGKFHGGQLIAHRLVLNGILEAPFECDELVLGKVAHLAYPGQVRLLYVLAGSRVRLPIDMQIHEAAVFGHLEVNNLTATGLITVFKGGSLAGAVDAHSFRVEKGGRYEGLLKTPAPAPVNDEEKIVPIEEPANITKFDENES